MKIYRITAIIGAEGNIRVAMKEFDCTENKKTLTVLLDDFGDTRLLKKEHLDVIRTAHHEDKIKVAPYSMWTLTPSGADEILANKIIEQVKIRVQYAEQIKHLCNK